MITMRSLPERNGRSAASARRLLRTRAVRTALCPVVAAGPQAAAAPGSALVAVDLVLVLAVGAVFMIRPDA